MSVSIRPDDDPEPTLPEELIEVLDQTGRLAQFASVSRGRRRGMCGYVAQAKSEDVRIKRAFFIDHLLATNDARLFGTGKSKDFFAELE